MLHDIYRFPRFGGRAEPGQISTDPGDPRMNPWLLWRPETPQAPAVLTVAELAECACPDLCDRDHANE